MKSSWVLQHLMEALCQQKDMMEKVNRLIVYYPQKTTAIFNTNKGLISRIYKELLLIHSKNTSQNKKKNGQTM